MLGDIGGLYGILQICAEMTIMLIQTVFGSGMQRFLIGSLFSIYKSRTVNINEETMPKQLLPRLVTAKFSIFSFFRCNSWSKSEKHLIEKAMERVEPKLDIADFLRK